MGVTALAWTSLMGMANAVPDLFDGFVVPAAVDKDLTIKAMCLQTADLELLYSDPVAMRISIDIWSHRRLPVWTHLEQTMHYEYNPIHNYDRTQERRAGRERNTKLDQTRDTTSSEDVSIKRNETDTEESSTSTSKAGYNSGSMVESERVGLDSETNRVATNSSTDDITSKDTLASGEDQVENETEFLRNYGNIGVTSTQDLIKQEREIAEFDIIQYIVDDFKQELCILVY